MLSLYFILFSFPSLRVRIIQGIVAPGRFGFQDITPATDSCTSSLSYSAFILSSPISLFQLVYLPAYPFSFFFSLFFFFFLRR